jgi:hypothetical protein
VTTKITSDLDDPTVFEDSSSQVSVFSVSALPKSTFPRNTTSAIYSILTLPFSAVFTAKAISLQFKFKNPPHSSNHEKPHLASLHTPRIRASSQSGGERHANFRQNIDRKDNHARRGGI